MDAKNAERKIVLFLRNYFARAKKQTAVVGLSGGLDSAVTLSLCARALGRRRVIAVMLPSPSTPARDLRDAQSLAKKLGVQAQKIPIGPILRSFGSLAEGKLSCANLSARIRMASLYSVAARHSGLVVGTGDKSEFMLGYFTKYGDGGADLFPIGGLYKTEVRALALHLGVPHSIAAKPPSPALWKGHTAEEELGFSYEVADKILSEIEKGKKRSELAKKFGKKTVDAIFSRMNANRHKLLPAPVFRV